MELLSGMYCRGISTDPVTVGKYLLSTTRLLGLFGSVPGKGRKVGIASDGAPLALSSYAKLSILI